MKQSRQRLLTPKGAATRARILAAAAKLVEASGAHRMSLDEVMEASGVGKSQLYHYFADKDALICEVIAFQTERVFAAQNPFIEKLDSWRALRQWRDALVQINRQKHAVGGCPIGSLANELADRSETERLLLVTSFDRWVAFIVDGLKQMQARGELAPDADPLKLATATLCAIQGGLLMAKTTRLTTPLEVALDMAMDHIERHRLRT
jgi:AcrR family transcriptional regulator